MKISRIDHLGIGVESIDAVLPYFEEVLGLKCYAIEEVADQKVKTAFLKVGEVKLELLEPTSPESAVAKWLEKGGTTSRCRADEHRFPASEVNRWHFDRTL